MNFREDLGTGYMYCYAPTHPCANKVGKVMEHVYVMTKLIGRQLLPHECVHHIDRNRKNNSPENLMLMTNSEHTKLHSIEDAGTVYVDRSCPVCGTNFLATERMSQKYCSPNCASEASKRFEIPASELSKLVWELPTAKIAETYGVSDTAIAKRCKKFGISKPPRGYWAKKLAGKL